MATRTRFVAGAVTVLLLLSGPWGWQNSTVRAEPPDLPADAEVAPLPVAVVDLQEVLTAAAQMDTERPKDAPAAAPQRNDPQQPQKEQLRSAFTLALQAAKDVAASRGCGVVLNIKARADAGQPISGAMHPYYLAESLDLTTDVIARLEARARQIEQPLPAPTTRPNDHSAIAAVDVRRAFSQMRHTRDLLAKTHALRRSQNNEERERSLKLITLSQQRDHAALDSPERKELDAKIKDATSALEAWKKSSQRDFARDQIIAMRDLFQEIATAAAELGRRRGCWLLLVAIRPDLPEDVSYLQSDQLRSIIASTTILYSAPQADLTNELLQILDAQYASQPIPWPTTQPTPVAQLPIRIVDQTQTTRQAPPSRLESAISPLATQRGYTLVFPTIRPNLPANVDNTNLDQLRNLINSFNLLYADPAADISADLVPGK